MIWGSPEVGSAGCYKGSARFCEGYAVVRGGSQVRFHGVPQSSTKVPRGSTRFCEGYGVVRSGSEVRSTGFDRVPQAFREPVGAQFHRRALIGPRWRRRAPTGFDSTVGSWSGPVVCLKLCNARLGIADGARPGQKVSGVEERSCASSEPILDPTSNGVQQTNCTGPSPLPQRLDDAALVHGHALGRAMTIVGSVEKTCRLRNWRLEMQRTIVSRNKAEAQKNGELAMVQSARNALIQVCVKIGENENGGCPAFVFNMLLPFKPS